MEPLEKYQKKVIYTNVWRFERKLSFEYQLSYSVNILKSLIRACAVCLVCPQVPTLLPDCFGCWFLESSGAFEQILKYTQRSKPRCLDFCQDFIVRSLCVSQDNKLTALEIFKSNHEM